MKILAVSDKVVRRLYVSNVRDLYPDIDLIIGCGDLPYYYLNFLRSALDAPMAYVLGNHDHGPQYTSDGRELKEVQGGDNLHARVLYERGLLLAGLEGSMRYRPAAKLMYTEGEMRQQILRLMPKLLWARARYQRPLDFLITHSPPFGIHDKKDVAHRGFKSFLWLLRVMQPRYMLHGHIHLYTEREQRTEHNGTQIINVYPMQVLEI